MPQWVFDILWTLGYAVLLFVMASVFAVFFDRMEHGRSSKATLLAVIFIVFLVGLTLNYWYRLP